MCKRCVCERSVCILICVGVCVKCVRVCKEYVRMCKSVLGRGVRWFRVWGSGFEMVVLCLMVLYESGIDGNGFGRVVLGLMVLYEKW